MSKLDRVWRQSRLSTTTKFRIYNSCVLSSLLYASETWTLLKADIAKLHEAFHMTNQRRLLGILWYEFVTNVEVATLSQLPSINEAISLMRHFLFGHVRRMDQAAPAHQALHFSVTSRQGSGQFGTWRRQLGRPRKCWVEQRSRSPRAQGSLLLMLGVLRRIGQHGGRYDPSTVKRRERERERERASESFCSTDSMQRAQLTA